MNGYGVDSRGRVSYYAGSDNSTASARMKQLGYEIGFITGLIAPSSYSSTLADRRLSGWSNSITRNNILIDSRNIFTGIGIHVRGNTAWTYVSYADNLK